MTAINLDADVVHMEKMTVKAKAEASRRFAMLPEGMRNSLCATFLNPARENDFFGPQTHDGREYFQEHTASIAQYSYTDKSNNTTYISYGEAKSKAGDILHFPANYGVENYDGALQWKPDEGRAVPYSSLMDPTAFYNIASIKHDSFKRVPNNYTHMSRIFDFHTHPSDPRGGAGLSGDDRKLLDGYKSNGKIIPASGGAFDASRQTFFGRESGVNYAWPFSEMRRILGCK